MDNLPAILKPLPCPFCGSEDIDIDIRFNSITPSYDYYYVLCHECFGSGGDYATKEEAIERWNKRHCCQ